MQHLESKLKSKNWQQITDDMHDKGYVIVENVVSNTHCDALIENYNNPVGYRKTVTMERYRFGLGEYKYFDYPLPRLVETLRVQLYPYLAPIANLWMRALNINTTFPKEFKGLQVLCHDNNQLKPTPLILKYNTGGFNTLHQDLYGEVYFPLQAVLFLNEPNKDYTGGEFVLTQQTPRAQSKAMVLQPKKGDLLIFTTNFRPIQGKKGYYRVTMKHGVSEIHSGKRHTLGIIFHDALN